LESKTYAKHEFAQNRTEIFRILLISFLNVSPVEKEFPVKIDTSLTKNPSKIHLQIFMVVFFLWMVRHSNLLIKI